MIGVLTQMAALMACGVAWRIFRPMAIEADTCRRSLTALVYILLLPALVLDVLWQAPLGLDSARIAVSAASGIVGTMLLAWIIYRFLLRSPGPTSAALILAASFPNATYLGLPLLEQLLGPEARSIAIQYDLFASTPLLLTLGMIIAAAYGSKSDKDSLLSGLFKVPALWAAIVAVGLNTAEVPQPVWLDEWLGMLAVGVVPLMLISLGMSLQWATWQPRTLHLLLPAIALQLLVMPFIVIAVANGIGLQGITLTGVILEAALPTMVIGLVVCDRFDLNTSLYALTVTITTALSLFTIPFWLNWAT